MTERLRQPQHVDATNPDHESHKGKQVVQVEDVLVDVVDDIYRESYRRLLVLVGTEKSLSHWLIFVFDYHLPEIAD